MLVRGKRYYMCVLSSISITRHQAVPMLYEVVYYVNIPYLFFLVFLHFMVGTIHLPILIMFLLKCINKKRKLNC